MAKGGKDGWDKAQIIGTFLTPVLLLFLGVFIQRGLPNNDQAARLAADILMSDPNSQTVELRRWALDVLERSSKIEIPFTVKEGLTKNVLAAGQRFVETGVQFQIHCDGASALCSEDFTTMFNAQTPMLARVTLDPEICQPLLLEFLFNGESVYKSGPLGQGHSAQTSDVTLYPLQSEQSNSGNPSQSELSQELVIRAQGLPAECSPDGKMQRWGGTLILLRPLPAE